MVGASSSLQTMPAGEPAKPSREPIISCDYERRSLCWQCNSVLKYVQ